MGKDEDVVVLSAVRTPMGSFGGSLRNMKVYDIGAVALREAIRRAAIDPAQLDEVIGGHTRQAGNGPNPTRTAAVRAGVPIHVHAITINNACPSSMKGTIIASQMIRTGDSQLILVGGMESMSTIPYFLKDVRWEGWRMGDRVIQDGWGDSIDPVCNYGMGVTAENLVAKYGISREEMDQFALESHQKAAKAQDVGAYDEEITPIQVPAYRGSPPFVFSRDESIRRDTSLEKMGQLRPSFKEGGSVTAGNSCGMTDGASSIVLTSRRVVKEMGFKPLFSIVSGASAAVDNAFMGEGPTLSMPRALEKAGMTLKDMDLIEVNEAFAAQVLANERVLKWDRYRVNIHGGAIALGHPTGCSGVRIITTLYYALKRRGKELGIAGICGGGGVSCAVVIRLEE